jgi:hypothetical protein
MGQSTYPKINTQIGRDTLGRFLVSGTAQLEDEGPVLERHGICATREKQRRGSRHIERAMMSSNLR